ncbi:MAG: hypothetical protein AAFY28_14750, partial [Actinomycetota bacterium]
MHRSRCRMLALFVACGLAACGGADDTTTSTSDATASTAPTSVGSNDDTSANTAAGTIPPSDAATPPSVSSTSIDPRVDVERKVAEQPGHMALRAAARSVPMDAAGTLAVRWLAIPAVRRAA